MNKKQEKIIQEENKNVEMWMWLWNDKRTTESFIIYHPFFFSRTEPMVSRDFKSK